MRLLLQYFQLEIYAHHYLIEILCWVCRQVLIDWLAEVTAVKQFSTATLHATVDIFDRVMQRTYVPRGTLQLIGVSGMLIMSRFVKKLSLRLLLLLLFLPKRLGVMTEKAED